MSGFPRNMCTILGDHCFYSYDTLMSIKSYTDIYIIISEHNERDLP